MQFYAALVTSHLRTKPKRMPAPHLIGIGIPTYNRPDMLARLLDSIDADWPIAVSDNGALLDESFKARYPAVNFVSQPELLTMWKNWNCAAQALDAEWILLPGDDDLYYPGAFDVIERAIRANPSADIVFFGHHIIDEHDCILDTWQPAGAALDAPAGFHHLRLGVPARPPGIAFRKAFFERLDGFSDEFKKTASDNDFYQRMTLLGKTVLVPDVVCGYRLWQSGGTLMLLAARVWLEDVDLWTRRMQLFAKLHTSYAYSDALRDEIYMANVIAGVDSLKRSGGGIVGAWRHATAIRYPFRARPLSHLRLLAHLLRPARR